MGRAKLQAGARTPIIYPDYLLKASVLPVSSQANGSLFWLPRVALGSLLSKLVKVCDGPVEDVYMYPYNVLTRPHVALGAHVIACASPSKLTIARTMGGADYAIDYTKVGWQNEVLKITGGRGVDVVYDPVGRIKGGIPGPELSRIRESGGGHPSID